MFKYCDIFHFFAFMELTSLYTNWYKNRKQHLQKTKQPTKPNRLSNNKKQTKRPKPVFTDSRKLDNIRDWEQVKIPKPSLEDLSDQSYEKSSDESPTSLASTNLPITSTNFVAGIKSKSFNTRKEMIRKELNGLKRDIEQTKHLQGIECFLGQCAP